MVLLSHPTGNAFVREAALALAKAGRLGEFHTTLAFFGSGWPGELRRRVYPEELMKFTRRHPWREAVRLLATRMGWDFFTRHERAWASVDAVYRSLDRKVASSLDSKKISAVYCYEDGALESFRSAKQLGIRRIYDLPIAHWSAVQRLLAEEADRLPEWAGTLGGLRDSEEKLRRKDEELELADVVICPSSFVRDSLPLDILQKKRVEVIPFGSPLVSQSAQKTPNAGPLKVLFAGSMTQRKGLADLFSAIKMLDSNLFEFNVLGTPLVDIQFYRSHLTEFIYHSPRAHSKVLELMQSCDVFVFPSIVEGRALVQQEAMSCGLPIIVTRNAGAEDLVEDGKAGFLVPIRNPNAIAEKLELLSKNRNLLAEMGRTAKSKAQSLTWESYRERIVEIAESVANQ